MDFLRFSKLLLKTYSQCENTLCSDSRYFTTKFLEIIKTLFPHFRSHCNSPLSPVTTAALYWKLRRPCVADVSHYREIKKIKARTEGRNLLDASERSLLHVGVQTHNPRVYDANTRTVSWESPGLRESFSGWINGSTSNDCCNFVALTARATYFAVRDDLVS